MSVNLPNRQAQRTQAALKVAFVSLLKESNYANITVEDIADRANIGRSTFYRHFDSKPDILLSWHEDIFKALDLGQYTAEQWVQTDPPAKFIAFLERMKYSRMPMHDFGKDAGYVLRKVGAIFTKQIEANLTQSFQDVQMNIPPLVLAQSIAGIYVWIFQWWIMENPAYTSHEMAMYVHQMLRGIINTATIKPL